MVKNNNSNTFGAHKKLVRIVLVVLFLVVILLLVASIISNNHASELPIAISEINVSFMIGEGIGVSIDTDMLNMGKVPAGNGAQRMFTLFTKEEPVQVYIDLSDSVAEYIKFTPNNFIIQPDVDNVTLTVTLYNTGNLSNGNYTGVATIYYFSVDE